MEKVEAEAEGAYPLVIAWNNFLYNECSLCFGWHVEAV